MTKKELAHAIAVEMNLPQMPVLEVVQRVFDGIIDTLVTKGRIAPQYRGLRGQGAKSEESPQSTHRRKCDGARQNGRHFQARS